jgi:hypothetical protein
MTITVRSKPAMIAPRLSDCEKPALEAVCALWWIP